jgi:hypothetical protein
LPPPLLPPPELDGEEDLPEPDLPPAGAGVEETPVEGVGSASADGGSLGAGGDASGACVEAAGAAGGRISFRCGRTDAASV